MRQDDTDRENLIVNRGFRDINPLLCGERHCTPSHSVGPAMREYYLLHYVFSGSGAFHIGNRVIPVGPGQIFVSAPYATTLYQADRETPWHYGWVGFESSLDLAFLFTWFVIDIPHAESIFRAICDCDYEHIAKELSICAKLYELLSMLSEQSILPQDRAPSYILKAVNYIESNYMQALSVSTLAAELGLDRSYFSTSFKQAIGKSPQQYIVDHRLEKAAELMLSHGYRPGQAGQSVGYPDIFNFSRMFKRKYGVSPSEYVAKSNHYTI